MMTFRHPLLIACLALFLAVAACSRPPRLEGRILGNLGDTIFLLSEERGILPVDTIPILDQAFTLELDGVKPGLYELSFSGGRSFVVHLSGQDIDLVLSERPSDSSRIQGSAYDTLINAYYRLADRLVRSVEALSVLSDQLLRGVAPDSIPVIQREINRTYRDLTRQHASAILRLGHSQRDNPVSLYLYATLLGSAKHEELESLDSALSSWSHRFDESANMLRIRACIAAEAAVSVGKPFVDVTLEAQDSSQVQLAQLVGRGRPVLLHFWTARSEYCQLAGRSLVPLYENYHARGLDVVAVSNDGGDPEAWRAACLAENLPWPQYIEPHDTQSPLEIYRVRTLPYSILFSADGRIMARGMSSLQLEMLLNNLLPED